MLTAALLLSILAAVPKEVAAQTAEAVDHSTLRVCADPNLLPLSNDKGEGFENKIAELLADELGVPVRYTWYPTTVGFVRNTLQARKCDLVMGTAAGDETMQNTNSYYRTAYALIYRRDAGLSLTSLDDPALQSIEIGVIAGTPPTTLLAQKGLLDHIHSYQLLVDTRFQQPSRDLVDDVAAGKVDVGILWGPFAGYFAKQESPPLVVVPLAAADSPVRLDFRITMGVRQNEPEWKRTINALIRKKQPEITKILLGYGVPLLDEKGQPIAP